MKTRVSFLLLVICATMNAQKMHFTMLDEVKEANISGTPEQYDLSIESISYDRTYDYGVITLDKKKTEQFIADMKELRSVYLSYVQTAKENNVESYQREIGKSDFRVNVFFSIGKGYKGYINTRSKLTYKFNVGQFLTGSSETINILMINTDRLISSGRSTVVSDNHALLFYNIEEIDEFISMLENAPSKIVDNSELDALFD
ncbi:hypothetical protein [Proteiniphilum sp. UBA5259]|jgi:hypothetical protein|uniref:hypothetical protein n=1 Tax=Proteiniphilum sp. UBA5259 TaxID=1947269 RepID=UPI00257C9E1E|nr:hypothetical protein [Proteiniphilum sp. UBA5259]